MDASFYSLFYRYLIFDDSGLIDFVNCRCTFREPPVVSKVSVASMLMECDMLYHHNKMRLSRLGAAFSETVVIRHVSGFVT